MLFLHLFDLFPGGGPILSPGEYTEPVDDALFLLWPRFGLDPGDVPTFLRVLRQLEADADAVLDRALANTASRPSQAPSEPEGPPAAPVLAALLDAGASLPGVWGDARGPTLSNGGAFGNVNRRKFSRLLAITLDALYMDILHNPFDHREMAEMWWWRPDPGDDPESVIRPGRNDE